MSVVVHISGHWKYRGKSNRSGRPTVCTDMDHARNLCRKVIREARANARYDRGRNTGFLADFISVKPEGTQPGDVVDVWSSKRGWHKGTIDSKGKARSNPEEN